MKNITIFFIPEKTENRCVRWKKTACEGGSEVEANRVADP